MTATEIKNSVLAALATVGAAAANSLGGWDALLELLVALMAADYMTGMLVAAVFKRSSKSESGALDSRAGFRGLIRKGAVLLVVFISVLLDTAADTHYIRSAVVLFFAGNEGLSLLENLGLMGVPYPRFMRDMLQALRDKGDGGDHHEQSA
jgi:toxin secretion/phage lysis holin